MLPPAVTLTSRASSMDQLPPIPRRTTICRKIGAPMMAMTTPSGSSAGRTAMRAHDVRAEHQCGAQQRAHRQHDAMVGAGDACAPGAGRRCRRTRPRRRPPPRHPRPPPSSRTIRRFTRSTSMPRWKASASPSSRPLRAADQPRQHEGDDQRERRDRQHLGPARAGQAAQHPQREVAQLAVVAGEGDEARQRRCEARRARCRPAAACWWRAGPGAPTSSTRAAVAAKPPQKAETGSA